MKIVINDCFGGFSLSEEGLNYFNNLLRKAGKKEYESSYDEDIERNCPELVATVEKLKGKSFGAHASLKVVKIPEYTDWVLERYDGKEWIAEAHRTWG